MTRILVVENEESICTLCRMALGADGFEVDTAADGKVAQEKIGSRHYDVFIFDIKMPVVDGKELFRWLQKEHPSLTAKVIIISGDTMAKDTRTFLDQVTAPFLPKPFTLGELKAAVRKVLEAGPPE